MWSFIAGCLSGVSMCRRWCSLSWKSMCLSTSMIGGACGPLASLQGLWVRKRRQWPWVWFKRTACYCCWFHLCLKLLFNVLVTLGNFSIFGSKFRTAGALLWPAKWCGMNHIQTVSRCKIQFMGKKCLYCCRKLKLCKLQINRMMTSLIYDSANSCLPSYLNI